MIVFSILFNRAMRQIDFVMAFPQAPIEMDMYMELPKDIDTRHGNSKDHVLRLLQNIYGQKQAGRVWNHHLTAKLLEVGFTQSLIDDCVSTVEIPSSLCMWMTGFSLGTKTIRSWL
jgi:hypothetical protein